MALIERLFGLDPETWGEEIGAHQFVAAMGELSRGEVTKAQLVAHWSLSAGDEAELDQLIAHVQSMPALERFKYRTELADVLYLTQEDDAPGYSTPAEIRTRLGVT